MAFNTELIRKAADQLDSARDAYAALSPSNTHGPWGPELSDGKSTYRASIELQDIGLRNDQRLLLQPYFDAVLQAHLPAIIREVEALIVNDEKAAKRTIQSEAKEQM